MCRVQWTIHELDERPDEPMYALVPDDGTRGLMIGEIDDVQAVLDKLQSFMSTGEHDGPISPRDYQLGYEWLDTQQASREYGVPQSSITWACRQGFIKDAVKNGHSWSFPAVTFRHWNRNRPGRGRRNK